MPMFDKKTVYQSDITKQDGGLTLKLTGGVRKGKYGEIVPIHVWGDPDGHDYWLAIENDNCASTLRQVPEGEWIVLEGAGSRASASLRWTLYEGRPEPLSDSGRPAEEVSMESVERAMELCLVAAGRVADVFSEEYGRPPTEEEKAMAVSMFIQLHR